MPCRYVFIRVVDILVREVLLTEGKICCLSAFISFLLFTHHSHTHARHRVHFPPERLMKIWTPNVAHKYTEVVRFTTLICGTNVMIQPSAPDRPNICIGSHVHPQSVFTTLYVHQCEYMHKDPFRTYSKSLSCWSRSSLVIVTLISARPSRESHMMLTK